MAIETSIDQTALSISVSAFQAKKSGCASTQSAHRPSAATRLPGARSATSRSTVSRKQAIATAVAASDAASSTSSGRALARAATAATSVQSSEVEPSTCSKPGVYT